VAICRQPINWCNSFFPNGYGGVGESITSVSFGASRKSVSGTDSAIDSAFCSTTWVSALQVVRSAWRYHNDYNKFQTDCARLGCKDAAACHRFPKLLQFRHLGQKATTWHGKCFSQDSEVAQTAATAEVAQAKTAVADAVGRRNTDVVIWDWVAWREVACRPGEGWAGWCIYEEA
jgi:hypothetical protein